MLNLNPKLLFGQNPPAAAEIHYSSADLTLIVTGLPANGVVVKEEGGAQIRLGDKLTTAELGVLSFNRGTFPESASGTPAEPRRSRVLLYVAQNADLTHSAVDAVTVTILLVVGPDALRAAATASTRTAAQVSSRLTASIPTATQLMSCSRHSSRHRSR